MDVLYKKVVNPTAGFEDRCIRDYEILRKFSDYLRKKGHRIVLTQGVYDLVHEGHARYLEKARSFGDILIVGVDSDELTRMRKGPNRPIVPEDERLRMLSHMRHVDLVVLRHAHDYIGELIHTVRPDVLVISESTADFTKEIAREYEGICDEIKCLPPQGTTSTTARIRNLTVDGASQLASVIQKSIENFINSNSKEK